MRSSSSSTGGERGSVLLALLFVGIGLAWISSALIASTRELALEYRAHREVVCARYAALSGLALADALTARTGPRYRFGEGNDAAEALIAVQMLGPGRCILASEGRCGSARYPIERRVDADAWCG